jgi:hypothetical protein
MVSSCGPWHFAVPMCSKTQFPTPSWEFLIALGLGWEVFQGRRPYRWTIWVCNDSPRFCSATFRGQQSDLLVWQVYSLTRVATLAPVALNIFSLDSTTPIHCQVCAKSSVAPVRPLFNRSCSQGYNQFPVCAHPNTTRFSKIELLALFVPFSLDLSLSGPCCLFAVDLTSHVCLLLWQSLRSL